MANNGGPQFAKAAAFARGIPARLADAQVRDLNRAAELGAQAMRQAAPVRTGRLKSRIGVLGKASPRRPIAVFGARGRLDYAVYQNNGFRHAYSGKLVPAKRFLEAGGRAALEHMKSRGYQ